MIGLTIALSVYSGLASAGVIAFALHKVARRRFRQRHRFLED